MSTSKECNSTIVPQVTSSLDPNAVPFVSRNSTCSVSMTTEGSGLTCSTQKQAIMKGQKRELVNPKMKMLCFVRLTKKANKVNHQERNTVELVLYSLIQDHVLSSNKKVAIKLMNK
jgi:hypothetical protein